MSSNRQCPDCRYLIDDLSKPCPECGGQFQVVLLGNRHVSWRLVLLASVYFVVHGMLCVWSLIDYYWGFAEGGE